MPTATQAHAQAYHLPTVRFAIGIVNVLEATAIQSNAAVNWLMVKAVTRQRIVCQTSATESRSAA